MLVSKDVTLTYTNSRGLSMTLAMNSPYDLHRCEDNLENEMISESLGFDHGEELVSSSLTPRRIEITGRLNTIRFRREMKHEMERVFNPTLKGTLTYHNAANGRAFTINCMPESLPDIPFRNSGGVYFVINLIAHYPFWFGNSVIEHISLINKRGVFPLVIPEDDGFIFGYRADTLQTTFENLGDATAGATFILKADGGTVTSPSITHVESGRQIRLNYFMQDGDEIRVISMPTRVAIIINGYKNGMSFLDFNPDGNFFMLDFGMNTIAYNADENVMNLSVSVFYDPVYLGVR